MSNALIHTAISFLGAVPQKGLLIHSLDIGLHPFASDVVHGVLNTPPVPLLSFDFDYATTDSDVQYVLSKIKDAGLSRQTVVLTVTNIEFFTEETVSQIIAAINNDVKVIIVTAYCNKTEITAPLFEKCLYIPYQGNGQ